MWEKSPLEKPSRIKNPRRRKKNPLMILDLTDQSDYSKKLSVLGPFLRLQNIPTNITTSVWVFYNLNIV